MKRRIYILSLLLLLLPAFAQAGDADDFGVWTEVGVQKILPRDFSVGVDGKLRTCDVSKKVSNIDVGTNVNYKLNKYVKFGVAYSFIESYKGSQAKYDEDEETSDYVSRQYTDSYWRPKHRFSVDVTPSVKLWRVLRLSLRERYQYTHQKKLTISSREDMWDLGKEDWAEDWEEDSKTKKEKNTHILRSRLKLEIDKKGLDWSPFVSVETQNYFKKKELDSGRSALRSVRTAVGTEYKINVRNSINVAYVFTYKHEDKKEDKNKYRMHAVCVGYNFKF